MASKKQQFDPQFIDQQTQKYIQSHNHQIQASSTQEIQQNPLDKTSLIQQFYKSYQRQLGKYLIIKHGHKITAVERQQQDLTFYCLGILQAQAKFPIKIFLIDHGKNQNPLDYQKSGFKMFWLETSIMVSGTTYSHSKELYFQKKIYNFFKQFLIPLIKKFMKAKINWEYMLTSEYTDVKVIADFKRQIVEEGNKKFLQIVRDLKNK